MDIKVIIRETYSGCFTPDIIYIDEDETKNDKVSGGIGVSALAGYYNLPWDTV